MTLRAAFAGALLLATLGPAPAAAAPRTVTVVIDKMKFGPLPAGLRAGDVVIWANRDMFLHTATARNGAFNVNLPPGKSGRTVLSRPGSIPFFCKYHPGMTGVLTVGR